MANRSSGLKGNVEEFRRSLTMFETIGYDAQCQSLHTSNRLIAVPAVAHDAVQHRHFGDPPSVGFEFEFDGELHEPNVALW
jgi:hypothetical protein